MLRTGTLLVLLLTTPSIAFGLTADELYAEIQSILKRIETLKQQVDTGSNVNVPLNTAGVGCVVLASNLRFGSRGDDVTKLQEFLAEMPEYYPERQVTGYYGRLTEAAVQRWQAAQGIISSGSPDSTGWGVIGPRTRAVLAACGTPPQGAVMEVTPVRGPVPLQVRVVATVNTGRSCEAGNYMLDFGDRTIVQAIPVPTNTCREVQQTFTHTYYYGGSYTIVLSSGNHRTTTVVQVSGAADPSGAGQTGPSGGTAISDTTFKVPGTFSLNVGRRATFNSLAVKLDSIDMAQNGAAQLSIQDGVYLYDPKLTPYTPVVVGTYLFTLTGLTASNATMNVTHYASSTQNAPSGFTVVPGIDGDLKRVQVQFSTFSCDSHTIQWGDGSTPASKTGESGCSAGGAISTYTAKHTYVQGGSFTIKVKRGLGSEEQATISVSD